VLACWRAITAPVLWVEAQDSTIWQWLGPQDSARAEIARRLACLANVTPRVMVDAGHMLHHDQPAALARMIEDFLAA
jgi:pimeloyl-ACP methyl ester carboxylesterase